MRKTMALAYGGLAYTAFFVSFTYAMGFISGFFVPKTIDTGTPTALGAALLIDAGLLLVFVLQHTIMARPAFKRWWTQYVPKPVERSTFVLMASVCLALVMWQWRPIGGTVWQVELAWARGVILALAALGWGLVFYSSFLIDHYDLFGLRQVWLYFRGRPYAEHPFVERSVYKCVRHPLMLGFMIAFWATPHMTMGHLFFALLVTGYILMGTRLEERDLLRHLGAAYADYRRRTPMLIPRPWRRRPPAADAAPDITRLDASAPTLVASSRPNGAARNWAKQIGVTGILFLAVKGVAWLVVPALVAHLWHT